LQWAKAAEVFMKDGANRVTHQEVLDNGVRVVLEPMAAVKSVAIGVWVNVGSRDEREGEEGYSHFLEHMLFKGTRRRSAAQISREIDALGGELNAFTTRETTTFYAKVLDQHIDPAIDLLADLFHHSRLDAKEIEKEKQVILEEIRMVRDDPEDFVQEWHTEQMLGRHPLGRPILGKPDTIHSLTRSRLQKYRQAYYQPGETVIAVAGRMVQKELLRSLGRAFGRFTAPGPSTPRNRWPARVFGGLQVSRKRLEQVHLSIGFQGLPVGHKDRYAAHTLNCILGGSVSSRLFLKIREKRALAYSIYSYLAPFSDSGTWTVYAATRPAEAAQVVELVRRELGQLRKQVPKRDVANAKNQMKGSLMLSLESTTSRMSKLARDILFEGRQTSLNEVLAGIDRVTDEHIHRVAGECLASDCFSLSALGPVTRAFVEPAFAG
jgi:predicted Zn-dependent peptidase